MLTIARPRRWFTLLMVTASCHSTAAAEPTRATEMFRRMKAHLDGIPAIDTHGHILPFEQLKNLAPTEFGPGMDLETIWRRSYYAWINPLTPRLPGKGFDEWWAEAKDDFDNARATSFYQYQLSAFQDLYGVDFETMTDEQAAAVNRKIYDNYQTRDWMYEVVTERSNIELVVNDPYWSRLYEVPDYKFSALVFNVSSLGRGFHPSEFTYPPDDPYTFARKHDINVESLDDYLHLIEELFKERKAAGAVCLKTTVAYQRTLHFADLPKERVAGLFGKKADEMTPEQIKMFEDFIMWRLVELAAKYDIPFQIHTGHARIQGSNPMNLVDLIGANPRTKFILFHGGYPWYSEVGAIIMRHGSHVWVDSCWLPTISYTMGKQAFHEWLEVMPSNRILWGSDTNHAEGVYGATEFTRRCIAEVLAEKVLNGDLRVEYAERIGRQILRENALELFPSMREQLWKHKGPLRP